MHSDNKYVLVLGTMCELANFLVLAAYVRILCIVRLLDYLLDYCNSL